MDAELAAGDFTDAPRGYTILCRKVREAGKRIGADGDDGAGAAFVEEVESGVLGFVFECDGGGEIFGFGFVCACAVGVAGCRESGFSQGDGEAAVTDVMCGFDGACVG